MADRSDPVAELCELLDRAGALITFDARRYARAAQEWPDCLPPMFGEAAIAVERWGLTGIGNGLWVARPPEAWPVPTVKVGEVWEQKSALIPTWDIAKALPQGSPYGCVTHHVMRIDGEHFLNSRGHHMPWQGIPGEHWRLLSPIPIREGDHADPAAPPRWEVAEPGPDAGGRPSPGDR